MTQNQEPVGAVVEIVERRNPPTGDLADELVVPNEVRINGQPLMCPADHPVKVHPVTVGDGELVLATLTLVARRIVVGAEWPDGSNVSQQQPTPDEAVA